MAKKRIVAVDIGTSSVKVAEVALGVGGFRVTRVGSADVDPASENPDAETRALKQAMSDAGIHGGECVVSVPRHQIVTRRLSNLPAKLEGERLKDVVRIQAEAELPFNANEAIYDFYDTCHLETTTSVELVATKRDGIEALVERVRSAGLKPTTIAPSVFGTAALARLHQRANGYQKRLMILNVGGSNTDVVIMRGDYFAFSRSFPVGAESFRAAPSESVPRFRVELRRTIQSYQREFMENGKESVEEVWLWGGGATSVFQSGETGETALITLLEEELNAPALIWSEATGFGDASAVESARNGWARLGIAAGLAVSALEQSLGVNLIPVEVQARKAQAAQGRRLVLVGAGFAAAIAAILGVAATIENRIEASSNELDRQIEALRVPKAAAAQTLGEMRTIAGMAQTRYSALDVLRELTALLPERTDVAVTVLSIEKTGKITANLEATSHDAISQAVKKIGESAWFTNVLPGQITTVQKENRQIRQASVAFRLATDANALAARLVGTEVEEGPEPVAQAGAPAGGPGGRGQGRQGNFNAPAGFPAGGFQPGQLPPGGFQPGQFPPGGFPQGGFGPAGRGGSPGGASSTQAVGSSNAGAKVEIKTDSGDFIAAPPPSGGGDAGEIRVFRIENDEKSP